MTDRVAAAWDGLKVQRALSNCCRLRASTDGGGMGTHLVVA